LQAVQQKVRFIKKDLNRSFTPENLERVLQAPSDELEAEDLELREIYETLKKEVEIFKPKHLVFVDLHTTTAFGGIFTIPTEEQNSLDLALSLHAPVIEGFLNGIHGTTLHFFNSNLFNIPTTAISFESGQHDERLSINRAVAALVNCLRHVGCVKPDDVESRHDDILREYSEGLPRFSKLVQIHRVNPEDNFQMRPDYKNFMAVAEGEILASDRNGNIMADRDGLILMPLYQPQGEDGFFIIEPIEGF
ncbi:MAG: succinylglutamate desuccinylase, partial [Saprospiraceae bacterium]|nr:succinylglutamate desuccinylase [Saprospiraceae bacterium]